MKNYLFIVVLLGLFGMTSCDEKVPAGLTLKDPVKSEDSVYQATVETPQQKKALIEEVTGVGCTNCPDGARQLKSIIQQNNNDAILIAIHGTGFADPYLESKHDFRTEDGTAIINSLGQPGLPAAAIDRIPDNQNRFFRSKSNWSSLIADRVNNVKTPVNLHLESTYSTDANNVELLTRVAFTSDYPDGLNLTVYVVENGIKDYQLDNGVKIPDYKHDHVFRDAITSTGGTRLDFGDHTAGTVLQKRFNFEPTITGDEPWNLDNCFIVVYLSDATTKEILHAEEVKLKP